MRFVLTAFAVLFVVGVIFAALVGVAIKLLFWLVAAVAVFAAGSWLLGKLSGASSRDVRSVDVEHRDRIYR